MSDVLLAKIVSLVANPLFMLITAVTSVAIVTNSEVAGLVLLAVGSLTILTTVGRDYIQERSFELKLDRTERRGIYLAGVFSFAAAAAVFGSQLFTREYWYYVAVLLVIFFGLFFIVNQYFDKASMHMGMFCFCVMLLAGDLHLGIGLLFVILPVIIWSRIKLHKHTWLQLMWGIVIGLVVGLLSWLV